MLERLHVFGSSLTCVHPGLVANGALAHKLYVGVGLGDLALDILKSRPGPHQVIVHGGYLSIKNPQLGNLGQRRPAVGDLVQSRVQRL
jgi:hypothetical protein